MAYQKQATISKHLLDKAALVFLRHPGQAYSRSDIQQILGVSKPTACRALAVLSTLIGLEEVSEGRVVYYQLPESEAERIKQSVDFVLSVTDREQLALSFLLSYGKSSGLFANTISEIEKKLEKAGLIVNISKDIFNKPEITQSIDSGNVNYIDTLLTAIETKTKIDILYKSPFSPDDRKHLLCPVGLYFRSGNLYLYAYDIDHESATSYAFSRIKELSLMYDDHYTLPEDVSMIEALKDPFGVVLREPQKVKVHISSKQAFYEKEKRWPDGTIISELDDGSIDMELTIADPYAFRTWVLSLGKECCVVYPEDIAEWVRSEHEEALTLYNSKLCQCPSCRQI